MKGRERTIFILPVQRPQPHNSNQQKERREGEKSRRTVELFQLYKLIYYFDLNLYIFMYLIVK